MTKLRFWIAACMLISVVSVGCSASQEAARAPQPPPPAPLVVGMTPDSPPLIFEMNDKIMGVDADFAQLLAQELKRPLVFMKARWARLIPLLLEGQIDIIMSGMTATEARKVQIDFTNPYLKTRIVTIMRAREIEKYNSLKKIMDASGSVGVVSKTTAEALVRRRFPKARIVGYASVQNGIFDLKTGRIDLFVGDGPTLLWLVSKDEAVLAGFWKPLAEESLAWGVNRTNTELVSTVNAVLAKWKQDGTLRRVLVRWLPYLDKLQEPYTGQAIEKETSPLR